MTKLKTADILDNSTKHVDRMSCDQMICKALNRSCKNKHYEC